MDNYTQIYLKDFGFLDVEQNVPLPLNFSLAEVKDISKRNSSYSKTIILPGTKNNNELLGMIFEVNIRFNDCTFKINRKVEATIFQNDQPVLSGWFKLININKVSPSDISFDENIQYECVLFSNQAGIYDRIKDLDIADIDLSAYDHILSLSAITASTTNTYDDVYKYIWHYTSDDKYRVGDFRPAVFVKPIWDRIFQQAGFTYTWDNDPVNTLTKFQKLLLPTNTKDLLIGDAEALARGMRVSFPTGYTVNGVNRFTKTPTVYFGVGNFFRTMEPANLTDAIVRPFNPAFYAQLKFNNETTGINFDGSYDNYSTTTNLFSTPKTGQYEVDLNLAGQINVTINTNVYVPNYLGTNTNPNRQYNDLAQPAIRYNVEFYKKDFSGTTFVLINSFSKLYDIPMTNVPVGGTTNRGFLSGTTSATYTLQCPRFILDLNQGDEIAVRLKIFSYRTQVIRTVLTGIGIQDYPPLTYQATINSYNPVDSYWKMTAVKNNLTTGDEIELSNMLPQKLKQVDLIKSVVNMFNLYLIPDENDANNIIIKTRDKYYQDFAGQYIDWTDKIDYSQQYQLQLLSELQNKTLNFTYKTANDDVNKRYFDQTGFLYGQYRLNFDNDFLNGEQRFELMFEPTPLVKTLVPLGNEGNTFIVPYLVYGQNTNPKILYDGGKISVSGYTIMDGNTAHTLNYYNFAGHFDNPTNPTLDINWNTNEYYFYNEVVENLTDNTLFNQYWFKYVELISESKLLTAYFNLNEYDIASLNLAKLVWIRDSYWYINRIIDYNAGTNTLTKVELIKALDYPSFKPKKITRSTVLTDVQSNTPWINVRGDRAMDNFQPGFTGNFVGGSNISVVGNNNYIQPGTKNSRVLGTGNKVSTSAINIAIDGDGNFVGGSSQKIFIQGNNNQLDGNNANVSLVNCDNIRLLNGLSNISLTNVSQQIFDDPTPKTFISEYIYIQNGFFINNSQIVDGGIDIVYTNPSNLTFQQNLIENGENIVFVNPNDGADLLNGTINGNEIDYEVLLDSI